MIITERRKMRSAFKKKREERKIGLIVRYFPFFGLRKK